MILSKSNKMCQKGIKYIKMLQTPNLSKKFFYEDKLIKL